MISKLSIEDLIKLMDIISEEKNEVFFNIHGDNIIVDNLLLDEGGILIIPIAGVNKYNSIIDKKDDLTIRVVAKIEYPFMIKTVEIKSFLSFNIPVKIENISFENGIISITYSNYKK